MVPYSAVNVTSRGWRFVVMLFVVVAVIATSSVTQAQTPDPVVIDFWHGWGGARVPLMDEIIARFEAMYPWITVNQRVMAPGSLGEQLTVGILGNAPPDLSMISFVDSLRFGLQGGLMPLGALVEKNNVDLGAHFYPPVVEMLENHPIVGEGTYYYLPQLVDANWYLYYNKDHLARAGLGEESLPTTWSELEQVGRRLNLTTGEGTYYQMGIDVVEGRRITEPYYEWLKSAGGRQYSDDLKRVTVGEPQSMGLSTLEWMLKFTNEVNGGIGAQNAVHSNAGTGFNQGRFSMMIRGPWSYFTVQAGAPDIDFGMAEMPYRDDFDFRPSMSLGWGYGIPANASHPDAAWLLLEFLTLDIDGGGYFMLQQARPGATIAFNQQTEYYDNPYWPVIQNSYNQSVPAEALAPIEGVLTMHRTMVTEAVTGGYSPQEAMDRLVTKWQGSLDTFWADVKQ